MAEMSHRNANPALTSALEAVANLCEDALAKLDHSSGLQHVLAVFFAATARTTPPTEMLEPVLPRPRLSESSLWRKQEAELSSRSAIQTPVRLRFSRPTLYANFGRVPN